MPTFTLRYSTWFVAFGFLFLSAIGLSAQVSSDSINEYYHEDDIIEEYKISRVFLVDVGLSLYSPNGFYKDKIEKDVLYGGNLSFLVQMQKEKPAFLGFELYYGYVGGLAKSYEIFDNNEFIFVDGRFSSNFFGVTSVLRYYPSIKIGPVEPYFEGRLGTKWTYSYLSESGFYSDDTPFDNFEFRDVDRVLTYGASFGAQVKVAPSGYLYLKSVYHSALSGSYNILKPLNERLSVVFPEEGFENVQTATGFWRFDLGYTFLF